MLVIDADGSGTIELNEFVEWYVTYKIEHKDNMVLGKSKAILLYQTRAKK